MRTCWTILVLAFLGGASAEDEGAWVDPRALLAGPRAFETQTLKVPGLAVLGAPFTRDPAVQGMREVRFRSLGGDSGLEVLAGDLVFVVPEGSPAAAAIEAQRPGELHLFTVEVQPARRVLGGAVDIPYLLAKVLSSKVMPFTDWPELLARREQEVGKTHWLLLDLKGPAPEALRKAEGYVLLEADCGPGKALDPAGPLALALDPARPPAGWGPEPLEARGIWRLRVDVLKEGLAVVREGLALRGVPSRPPDWREDEDRSLRHRVRLDPGEAELKAWFGMLARIAPEADLKGLEAGMLALLPARNPTVRAALDLEAEGKLTPEASEAAREADAPYRKLLEEAEALAGGGAKP